MVVRVALSPIPKPRMKRSADLSSAAYTGQPLSRPISLGDGSGISIADIRMEPPQRRSGNTLGSPFLRVHLEEAVTLRFGRIRLLRARPLISPNFLQRMTLIRAC